MINLAFIIGYSGTAIPSLSKALSKESEKNGFRYIITTDSQATKHEEFIKNADAIFIYSAGLSTDVEKAISQSSAKIIISGSDSTVHLSKATNEVISKAIAFYKFGGEQNLTQLIRLLLQALGENIEVDGLKKVPWHGIWHPKYGTFNELNDYLKIYPHNEKKFVGIMFYRSIWLYGNTDYVKPIIDALEEEGIGVIPVFTYSFGDTRVDAPDSESTIQTFFIKDEKPTIDVLINLTSFFLLSRKIIRLKSEGFKSVRGLELLKKMNIPILQGVRDFSKGINDWLSDETGISYMSQIYTVIMPEVDGIIEPIYLGGAKIDPQGIKRYECFEHHAQYIAKRVKKWITLRYLPPEKRKIAIVLITPPCKSLEGSIGVGFGLDVPESVVRLLKDLKKRGYNIGETLPKDGKELVEMFTERKAISEFRWTSVDEIVKKGGAVGYSDLKTYMNWFNELPIDTKEKIQEDWGYPEDILLGKAPKPLIGMVYNNKFVIPGISFGNVLVITQPKPGCAGAACDGNVCKILHDPSISPPHQWFAVYRWISRIWKANMIVHFGTHGYLEFRPGKGVGLSPSCWPEISIDDIPHLYVYNVSNPMEGVIAKRRSYATIVDHMYPPLAMAEVLDEIDSLLTEYSKAEQLGDNARVRVIYEELIKKAKESNIPITKEDPKHVVEEIHNYLNATMETQIEMGLHIFGYPTKNSVKLAEYVVTTMSYDTHSFHSIRRCLAECIGLDYNHLRNNKLVINEYGLLNKDTLKILHKVAIEVLKTLLENETNNEKLTMEAFTEILHKKLIENMSSKVNELKLKFTSKAEALEAFQRALEIAKRIQECKVETDGFLYGISGQFIEPGPSGSITRGKIEILPTGRNFYAIDPTSIPTRAAWKIGIETAEKLLEHYDKHHGKYPETIGQWLWSLDGYKGDGEQISQILYLLGTKPIWRTDGTVKGVEVIPLEELGRPRIDVSVRISGIVRDTLPIYFQLIDEAVSKVVMLEESTDVNYVKKHYLEYLTELRGEKITKLQNVGFGVALQVLMDLE